MGQVHTCSRLSHRNPTGENTVDQCLFFVVYLFIALIHCNIIINRIICNYISFSENLQELYQNAEDTVTNLKLYSLGNKCYLVITIPETYVKWQLIPTNSFLLPGH